MIREDKAWYIIALSEFLEAQVGLDAQGLAPKLCWLGVSVKSLDKLVFELQIRARLLSTFNGSRPGLKYEHVQSLFFRNRKPIALPRIILFLTREAYTAQN